MNEKKKDRPYEFQGNFEDIKAEVEDMGIGIRELIIDARNCLGFFVHDTDELKELGKGIMAADVIMDNISSKRINKIIEIGKEKFEDCSQADLLQMAGSTALMTILAIHRARYLEIEDGKNDEQA